MPRWEAFDFRKFLKNGYFVRISKMVRISVFCLNKLFSYFLIIFHMPKFQSCICNLKVTLVSKRGF